MTEQEKKQGWFKKILAKYNKLLPWLCPGG